jgi:hypothetical protein
MCYPRKRKWRKQEKFMKYFQELEKEWGFLSNEPGRAAERRQADNAAAKAATKDKTSPGQAQDSAKSKGDYTIDPITLKKVSHVDTEIVADKPHEAVLDNDLTASEMSAAEQEVSSSSVRFEHEPPVSGVTPTNQPEVDEPAQSPETLSSAKSDEALGSNSELSDIQLNQELKAADLDSTIDKPKYRDSAKEFEKFFAGAKETETLGGKNKPAVSTETTIIDTLEGFYVQATSPDRIRATYQTLDQERYSLADTDSVVSNRGTSIKPVNEPGTTLNEVDIHDPEQVRPEYCQPLEENRDSTSADSQKIDPTIHQPKRRPVAYLMDELDFDYLAPDQLRTVYPQSSQQNPTSTENDFESGAIKPTANTNTGGDKAESIENLGSALRQAKKTADDHVEEMFRVKRAYDYSRANNVAEPRLFETKNFFTPVNRKAAGRIATMEYIIVTSNQTQIHTRTLPFRDDKPPHDLYSALSEMERPERYVKTIAKLEKKGWRPIGGGGPGKLLVFERELETRSSVPFRTALRISAAIVGVTAIASIMAFFVD